MNTSISIASALVLCSGLLVGCSKAPDTKATDAATSEPTADTSYLDELAAKQGIQMDQSMLESRMVMKSASGSENEILNHCSDARGIKRATSATKSKAAPVRVMGSRTP